MWYLYNMKMIRLRFRILAAAFLALSLTMVQGCTGRQDQDDGVVLETETFRLTVGKDAIVRSLVIKKTNEEMLLKDAGVPLFSVTQDRPFNNETKLQHPNTRTTYKADSLSWDGERLTVGFDTAPYEAVVKVDAGAGYLRFTLEDFICEPEDYSNLALDLPPVAEFRILQLPVKERDHYGEWLNCMWDDASAVCVAGCDPWSLIWHEDRTDGRVLTADLLSGKKLRGGSAAIIAAEGKEPFLDAMDRFEADLDLPRGVQSRRSPMLNRSIYWTSDANLSNIDRHIAIARKAGLKMMLFYYTCFVKSRGYRLMGDYDLKDDYPGGLDDLRKNNLKEGLGFAVAENFGSLILTLRNRLHSAAIDFSEVSCVVHRETDDNCRKAITSDRHAKQIVRTEIPHEQLQHERSAAHDSNINLGNAADQRKAGAAKEHDHHAERHGK